MGASRGATTGEELHVHRLTLYTGTQEQNGPNT